MDSALLVDRLQFAFTVTFHYLFPQLTMGLALLIVVLKTLALRTGYEHYNESARFWGRIFAINFAIGVVTGIPMEFQFGTNWSRFSRSAGGVIGQTLAMEGMYSFFLESTFLGLFIYGERKLSPRAHWVAAFLVFLGAWLSGYFIIATDAWMQHPTGYSTTAAGGIALTSLSGLVFNPWIFWQYLHNMTGAVVTGSFVMSALGAFYLLTDRHGEHARDFLRVGVIAGSIATVMMIFPTGDGQGRNIANHQPATLAAMEGLFETTPAAPLAIIGQPDIERRRLDNPVTVPGALSLLTYRRWSGTVRGLDAFPQSDWPDNLVLLYYSYHIMVGLGTLLVMVMAIASWKLRRGELYGSKPVLWSLMLSFPLPYIATTAGWMTAELGRQPWLIYGVMRTAAGHSPKVTAGNGIFTLLGFMGIYSLLAALFLFLVYREIDAGPETEAGHGPQTRPAADEIAQRI
jgi:cytochrome d ubiquinol oxidase subunit I